MKEYRKSMILFNVGSLVDECRFALYFSDYVPEGNGWNPANKVIVFMFYRGVNRKVILPEGYLIDFDPV